MEGRKKGVKKEKWVEKKEVRGDVLPPRFSPDRTMDREIQGRGRGG